VPQVHERDVCETGSWPSQLVVFPIDTRCLCRSRSARLPDQTAWLTFRTLRHARALSCPASPAASAHSCSSVRVLCRSLLQNDLQAGAGTSRASDARLMSRTPTSRASDAPCQAACCVNGHATLKRCHISCTASMTADEGDDVSCPHASRRALCMDYDRVDIAGMTLTH
jgi:hypothetical protein